MYEIINITPEDFFNLFTAVRAEHKEIRRRTSNMTLEEYKEKFKCYRVRNRGTRSIGEPYELKAGFATNTATGELCSMFNATDHKLGHVMVEAAVRLGAKRLNCLDGFLVKLYADHGFVPVCAVEHHRHTAERPRPLVVYMAHSSTKFGAAAMHWIGNGNPDLPSMGMTDRTVLPAMGLAVRRSRGCGDDDDEGCPSRAERAAVTPVEIRERVTALTSAAERVPCQRRDE